mgnify:CR=1 FL=1
MALLFGRREKPMIDDYAVQVDSNLKLAMRNAEADEPVPIEQTTPVKSAISLIYQQPVCEREADGLAAAKQRMEADLSNLLHIRELTDMAIADRERAIKAYAASLEIIETGPGINEAKINSAAEAIRSAVAADVRQAAE